MISKHVDNKIVEKVVEAVVNHVITFHLVESKSYVANAASMEVLVGSYVAF